MLPILHMSCMGMYEEHVQFPIEVGERLVNNLLEKAVIYFESVDGVFP